MIKNSCGNNSGCTYNWDWEPRLNHERSSDIKGQRRQIPGKNIPRSKKDKSEGFIRRAVLSVQY